MSFISKAVNIGFGAIFALTVLLSFGRALQYCADRSAWGIPAMLLVAAAAAALAYSVFKLEKVFAKKTNGDEKKCDKIFWCMAAALLILQVVFALATDFQPKNDLSHVSTAAKNLVESGAEHLYDGLPPRHHHYFAVYPNNHALFLYIFGLYKITYVITGSVSNFLPIFFNIVGLDVSYILMYKTAKLVYSPEKALTCAVRGIMFLPLIVYSTFFYTDSLAMPFVTAAVYFYIRWRSSAESDVGIKSRIALIAACALCLAIGYKIKGSAIILLVAILIDLVFRKMKITRKAASAVVLAVVLALVSTVVSSAATALMQVSPEEQEEYEFPFVHWVMMSADGNGGYNFYDFAYTKSHFGYDNKVSADVDRLKDKVKSQGAGGFAKHIVNKLTYTWSEGSYMSGYYNKNCKFLNSLPYYALAEILHFSLLIMVCRGFWQKRSSKDDVLSKTFFLKVTLMGLLAFLLIWEARCRYLVSFFLLFALI